MLVSLAFGAEIRDIEINRDGHRYTLISTTHFDATPDQVFRVLIDYDQLSEISKSIKESRFLQADDEGQELVFTRIRSCLLFYCKTVDKTERLEFTRPAHIQTTAIPERSDLRYSQSEWNLSVDDDGGTQVIYRLAFEPNFWVPPIIGPLVIRKAIVEDGAYAVEKIEALAQKLHEEDIVAGT